MADDFVTNSGSGGKTFRSLEDGSGKQWPSSVVAFATALGTPNTIAVPLAGALADNTSNPTTLLLGSCNLVFDGSTWDRLPGTAADGMTVNLGANNDVTIVGTSGGQAVEIIGDVVHDNTAPSRPVTIGARASTSVPTAVSTDGNACHVWVNRLGAVKTVFVDETGDSLVDGALDALQVKIVSSSTIAVTVSGVATLAEQQTQTTSLQLLDDVVATAGSAALTKGNQVAGTDGTNARILAVNTSGHLKIEDGGNSITVDGTVNAAQSGAWNVTNVSGTVSLPTGASTLAEQQTQTTSLQLLDDAVATTGSAITTKGFAASGTDGTNARVLKTDSSGELQIDVLTLPALPTGSNVIGAVTQSGTWTVQPGNTQNTTEWLVSDRPQTAGGLSMHKLISAASTNATSVKASAGQVYSVQAFNKNASPRYLKLYNKASAPTVGTDTPVKVLMIPGNTAGAGFVHSWEKGLAFSTGIAFALTTGIDDSDTGAVAASEIATNLDYK